LRLPLFFVYITQKLGTGFDDISQKGWAWRTKEQGRFDFGGF